MTAVLNCISNGKDLKGSKKIYMSVLPLDLKGHQLRLPVMLDGGDMVKVHDMRHNLILIC